MPTAGFGRYGCFRAMQAAVRASGLRVGCSPLGTTPSGSRHREGGQFFLANQNLQDLVLKCLLRTKDSRVVTAWQALFGTQEGPPKTTTKTAHCGSVCRIFTHVPPPIHRLVHRIASRRTVAPTLQFYDSVTTARKSICGKVCGLRQARSNPSNMGTRCKVSCPSSRDGGRIIARWPTSDARQRSYRTPRARSQP